MGTSKAEGKRSLSEMVDEDEEEDDDQRENLGFTGEEAEKKKRGKKAALGGGSSSIICQVENCTADMGQAKRYHRRHKVCEFHAKATGVCVSGLQQRFCQQCSRFHELSEFDEAKRSCRRRLAGHNERRRKSSVESQGGEGSNRPESF